MGVKSSMTQTCQKSGGEYRLFWTALYGGHWEVLKRDLSGYLYTVLHQQNWSCPRTIKSGKQTVLLEEKNNEKWEQYVIDLLFDLELTKTYCKPINKAKSRYKCMCENRLNGNT